MFKVAGQNSKPWEQRDYPAGLRVLVVDGNVVFLHNVKNMLRECRYEATETTKGREVLEKLRKNKDDYDVVLCGDGMPDMDSFELLKILALETDIPVIMMSVRDDMRSAMKCIRRGAQYCLVKPVQLSDLRNIWQHVLRKNMLDSSKIESSAGGEIEENLPLERSRDNRKEKMEGGEIIQHLDQNSQCRKRRFSWTEDLKTEFVNVVQELGIDRATPKMVLENMNDPELTREIIASHLQKYRNSLKKQDNGNLKKENNVDSQRIQRGLPNMTSILPSHNNSRPPLYPCHRGLPQQQNVQPQMTHPRSVRTNLTRVVSHPQFNANSQAFLSSQIGHTNSFGQIARGSITGIASYSDPHFGSFNHADMYALEDDFSINHDSLLRDHMSQTFQTRLPNSTIGTTQSSLSESISNDIAGGSCQMTPPLRPPENNDQLHDPYQSDNLNDKLQEMMQIMFEDQQQHTTGDGGY